MGVWKTRKSGIRNQETDPETEPEPEPVDTWTLELGPDTLRPFRCFRIESPAMNVERGFLLVLFSGSDVVGSFGGSLDWLNSTG